MTGEITGEIESAVHCTKNAKSRHKSKPFYMGSSHRK